MRQSVCMSRVGRFGRWVGTWTWRTRRSGACLTAEPCLSVPVAGRGQVGWRRDRGGAQCGVCAYSRVSLRARLGTTNDARKSGKNLLPVHRKATISPSAASKV